LKSTSSERRIRGSGAEVDSCTSRDDYFICVFHRITPFRKQGSLVSPEFVGSLTWEKAVVRAIATTCNASVTAPDEKRVTKKGDQTGSNLCRHDSSYKHYGSRSTGSKASSLCLASKQLRRAPSLLRGEPPLHRPSESPHKLCAAQRPPRVGTPTNRAGNQVTSMIGKNYFFSLWTQPQNRTTLEARIHMSAPSSRRPCLALHRCAPPVQLPPTNGNSSALVGVMSWVWQTGM
jgi:hypothetical protein